MKNKVIYYAASELNIPKEKIGGAETGAKRCFNNIISSGIDAVFIPKITLYYGFFAFVKSFFKTKKILKKLFSSNEYSLFYITAFYKRQSKIELYFIRLAKKNGLKVIYEPKNGSYIREYFSRNSSYKKRIDLTLGFCDLILCQGLEYIEFFSLKNVDNTVYVPNYVNSVSSIDDLIVDDCIDIIYFGRLTKEKNIEFIIELCKKISIDHKVKCNLIGAGEKKYLDKLNKLIFEYNMENVVEIFDRMPLAKIRLIALKSDFFVFPSVEPEEGHSNSLTEAMSFGCVPVVSDNGFNKSVVGNDIFVEPKIDLESYYNKIIYLNKDLLNYKHIVVERVTKNYTSKIVVNRQIDAITKLLELNN